MKLTRTLDSRPLRAVAATWLVTLAAVASQVAFAQPAPPAPPPSHGIGMHGGHGMHGPGGMGGMGMMLGGHQVERMLDLVNATPEQRAQIRQITSSARNDLLAQRDAGRTLHQQAQSVFMQPNIDANAAEQLRQQMLAQHDRSSKRVLQAVLDVSRVLTPEQRKLLSDRFQQRRAMMEQHHPRGARPGADGASRPSR